MIAGKGIKELEDQKAKEDLYRSLKKGNAQQITVATGEGEKRYFIAANPQFKTIDLYDHQMKKIKREELLGTSAKATKSLKSRAQSSEELPKKKQSRKSKMSV